MSTAVLPSSRCPCPFLMDVLAKDLSPLISFRSLGPSIPFPALETPLENIHLFFFVPLPRLTPPGFIPPECSSPKICFPSLLSPFHSQVPLRLHNLKSSHLALMYSFHPHWWVGCDPLPHPWFLGTSTSSLSGLDG